MALPTRFCRVNGRQTIVASNLAADATATGIVGAVADDQPDGRGFWIPAHIHVCVTRDGSIILDLKRNRYYGLGREETELLAESVNGWPTPSWRTALRGQGSTRGLASTAASALCASLREDGLLSVQRPAVDTTRSARRIDMKTEWISVGDELDVSGSVHARDVVRLAVAFGWARYSLRCRPLLSVVEAVRRTKRRGLDAGLTVEIFRMAALVDIFRQLRPYFFAAEGHCLLHALTLVKFLSAYDCFPEWVIGVNTQPWAAHSWVQWQNFLLDTNPEKVCLYTPIMAV